MSNNNNRRCVLLTGATGFVGSHLARRLVTANCNVHLIIRKESDCTLLEDLLCQVALHKHDGTIGSMLTIMDSVKPDVVFHLASLFLSQHQSKDIDLLIQSNVLFSTQLVEAMTVCGVSYLVNTGTSWQHFENREYEPVNLYAATKQAFESILKFYFQTTPLKAITLKLFDSYGPGDPRPKLFTLLRKVAVEQQKLAMSPGEQLIDLVYIDDIVDCFVLAAERLLADVVTYHESYAVSSGAPVRLRELVETYGRVIGKPLPIEWGGRPYRPREVMVPWDTGSPLPGWRPRVGLEVGIARIEGLTLSNSKSFGEESR